jgi:hypothetical protein
MSHPAEARSASAPPSLSEGARVLILRVCNDNPFYVLSALLVLVGLWTSFGAQARADQTWALMFGLAGYTLLLAVPACLLVRFGGVWEDVRTVLLLVVLMFLATSVTFDETLARNPRLGVTCYVAGLLFAVAVSEEMLRGMRLAMPGWFRVPYYLMLALFFLYPVALVPLLDRPRGEALQWALFGFSPAAGLVFLTLLPAIRRGPEYVRDNGSPWRWPLYPWSLFVFLGFGVAARSFLLCWSMQHVERTEPERFIFGPYFLAPFLLASAVLLMEMGLVARSRGALRAALAMPVVLVVLAVVGHRPDPLFREFLALFIARLGGTPLYLTVLAAAGFYAYATLRRAPGAVAALTASLAALAVVGPGTLDVHGLTPPRPIPVLVVAAMQLGLGLRRRDAWRCLAGAGCLVVAAMDAPWDAWALPHRGPIAFHLALVAVLGVGAAFEDAFGRALRTAGAMMALLACLVVLTGRFDRSASIPPWAIEAYPPMVVALIAGYGLLLGHRPSLAAAALGLCGCLAAVGWRGYSALRQAIAGLDYIALGLVLLALAELISLAKAGLLPRRIARDKGKVPDSSS